MRVCVGCIVLSNGVNWNKMDLVDPKKSQVLKHCTYTWKKMVVCSTGPYGYQQSHEFSPQQLHVTELSPCESARLKFYTRVCSVSGCWKLCISVFLGEFWKPDQRLDQRCTHKPWTFLSITRRVTAGKQHHHLNVEQEHWLESGKTRPDNQLPFKSVLKQQTPY